MKDKDNESVIEDTGETLCANCGSVKIVEEGKLICPHCDVQIDFFGEDDDDDI